MADRIVLNSGEQGVSVLNQLEGGIAEPRPRRAGNQARVQRQLKGPSGTVPAGGSQRSGLHHRAHATGDRRVVAQDRALRLGKSRSDQA